MCCNRNRGGGYNKLAPYHIKHTMKEEIRDVLGVGDTSFKVPMLVYESVDEADKAAGIVGAGVKEMNNNLLYRGTYAEARSLIVDIVQELSKVAFLTKDTGEKDDKGAPIFERDQQKDSDAKYVERAMLLAPNVTVAQVQAEITKRARGYKTKDAEGKDVEVPALAADITQRERKPGKPPKLAQRWKDTALSFLSGKRDVTKAIALIKKTINKDFVSPVATPKDDPKNVEALGWLMKETQDAQDAFGAIK